jgi:hypothetical protein
MLNIVMLDVLSRLSVLGSDGQGTPITNPEMVEALVPFG